MSNAGTQSRNEQLWTECVRLLEDGYSPRRVVQMLVHQNWGPEEAQEFVATAQSYLHQEQATPVRVAEARSGGRGGSCNMPGCGSSAGCWWPA
ncbi:MAG: hypothetical protein U0903_08075 [Planctomycetales bacterium]